MSAPRPILVFDSGVGGLSVLRSIRRELPTASFIYAADNAGFPYGTRSAEEIETRIPALLGRLTERFAPGLIVIACNTASTIALAAVRNALDVPVVGTVPAIKPAAAMSRSRAIGVLGTPATIVQPYVDRLAAEFASDCIVVRHGSARLVEIAESQLRGHAPEPGSLAAILAELLDQPGGDKVDTVVLACTHFPLLAEPLMAAAPRPITFLDGNDGIARRTAALCEGMDWNGAAEGDIAIFTAPLGEDDPLRDSLKAFGLTRIETL